MMLANYPSTKWEETCKNALLNQKKNGQAPGQPYSFIITIIITSSSSYTVTQPQSLISQPHDQLATTSSPNQNQDRDDYTASSIPKQNHVTYPEVKGPVLLLEDSINRGIRQHKLTRIYYLNKQTVGGETREMNQYLNQMQERHNYDYIIIHFKTNDVGKLSVNKV